jgi:hypothetical protein
VAGVPRALMTARSLSMFRLQLELTCWPMDQFALDRLALAESSLPLRWSAGLAFACVSPLGLSLRLALARLAAFPIHR